MLIGKIKGFSFFVGCLFILSQALVYSSNDIQIFGGMDLGRIEKGQDASEALNSAYEFKKFFLQRSYVNLSVNKEISETQLISFGIGGVMWKGYTNSNITSATTKFNVGPGISHLYMDQKLGPFNLKLGYFPYKYNGRSKNLGEYLFRAEAYPVILYTGGWSWLNSSHYSAVGSKISWEAFDEKVKMDLLFFVEYFNSPIYDITPALIVNYQPISSITLGSGISFHRLLTPTEKTKSQRTKEFTYYQDIPIPPTNNSWHVSHNNSESIQFDALNTLFTEAELKQKLFDDADEIAKIVERVNSPDDIILVIDTLTIKSDARLISGLNEDVSPELSQLGIDSITRTKYEKSVSFDLTTIRLMAFFDFNFNVLLSIPNDYGQANFYGEISVLGSKNYPIFFTSYLERTPIMLGLSIPTYILDNLSIEVEYLKNPHMESLRSVTGLLDLVPDPDFPNNELYTKDDFKWSINGSKKLGSTVSINFQVANDHFRPKNGDTTPIFVPITNELSHWYWMLRLQWAM